ncbi:MAG: biotin--[acetyl-CoA-carboxylase] ligase [Spirochaetota bacterium]
MELLQVRNPFQTPIYYIPSVDSTMRVARLELGEYCEHGTVVAAGEQTAGRGRVSGRNWNAGRGEGLLFTIVCRKEMVPAPVSSLPIRMALALSKMLKKRVGLSPLIKWPNDVLIHGKKICGILCESSKEHVYCGIGLNVKQTSFSKDLRTPATSIYLENGETPEPLELLPFFLDELYSLLSVVQLPMMVRPWLYRLDEEVSFVEGDPGQGKRVSGIVTGVGEHGELRLLQKSGKIRSLYSGE